MLITRIPTTRCRLTALFRHVHAQRTITERSSVGTDASTQRLGFRKFHKVPTNLCPRAIHDDANVDNLITQISSHSVNNLLFTHAFVRDIPHESRIRRFRRKRRLVSLALFMVMILMLIPRCAFGVLPSVLARSFTKRTSTSVFVFIIGIISPTSHGVENRIVDDTNHPHKLYIQPTVVRVQRCCLRTRQRDDDDDDDRTHRQSTRTHARARTHQRTHAQPPPVDNPTTIRRDRTHDESTDRDRDRASFRPTDRRRKTARASRARSRDVVPLHRRALSRRRFDARASASSSWFSKPYLNPTR